VSSGQRPSFSFLFEKKMDQAKGRQGRKEASSLSSTLASSTLITLFSKMLKFFKNYFFQIKKIL
jgi:hypothetical protein